MELEVGELYINAIGDVVKIIGTEYLLERVFYDREAIAYRSDGWTYCGEPNMRLVALVQ